MQEALKNYSRTYALDVKDSDRERDFDLSSLVIIGTPVSLGDKSSLAGKRNNETPAEQSSLPAWKQEVTDAQGRRRFHGAFTGGFSAGYYNTVGSQEGWTPQTFVSSRGNRKQHVQRTQDFMDEEDVDPRMLGAGQTPAPGHASTVEVASGKQEEDALHVKGLGFTSTLSASGPLSDVSWKFVPARNVDVGFVWFAPPRVPQGFVSKRSAVPGQALSRLLRGATGGMSDRFVAARTAEEQRKHDERTAEEQRALRFRTFGRDTRTEQNWTPSDLLLKRFGVAQEAKKAKRKQQGTVPQVRPVGPPVPIATRLVAALGAVEEPPSKKHRHKKHKKHKKAKSKKKKKKKSSSSGGGGSGLALKQKKGGN